MANAENDQMDVLEKADKGSNGIANISIDFADNGCTLRVSYKDPKKKSKHLVFQKPHEAAEKIESLLGAEDEDEK